MISEKENTWGVRVSTSLNSRSLSWLSEVETNGGGIFIPVNHLALVEECKEIRDVHSRSDCSLLKNSNVVTNAYIVESCSNSSKFLYFGRICTVQKSPVRTYQAKLHFFILFDQGFQHS